MNNHHVIALIITIFLSVTVLYELFKPICYSCSNFEKERTYNYNNLDYGVFTRIGSDLNFDYISCPKNSVMLNSTKLNSKPLHDYCPQVFIIGARKGGTTSLYQYLSRHPDFEGIRLDKGSSAGETFYFSRFYNRRSWEHYISEFPVNKSTGDSSVCNLVNCMVPERLYTSCGRAVKVIVLLRDPIERYQSNFRMRVRLHNTRTIDSSSKISTFLMKEAHQLYQSFAQRNVNMNDSTANINKLLCSFEPAKNCIYEGLYYIHLHNWLCNFPAENILIVNSEEFYNNTNYIFSQVLDFLGLSPLNHEISDKITKVIYNNGGKVKDELDFRLLSSSDKKILQTIYKPFNKKLNELLGWDSDIWSNE